MPESCKACRKGVKGCLELPATDEELKKEKMFHEFYKGCIADLMGFKYFTVLSLTTRGPIKLRHRDVADETACGKGYSLKDHLVCYIHDFPNFPSRVLKSSRIIMHWNGYFSNENGISVSFFRRPGGDKPAKRQTGPEPSKREICWFDLGSVCTELVK